MHDLSVFAPVIRNLSKKIRPKQHYDSDDIYQHLCEKALKVLPKLETLSVDDAKKKMSTILKNERSDFFRKERVRTNIHLSIGVLNSQSEETFDFDSAVDAAFMELSKIFGNAPMVPQEVSEYNELIADIRVWLESQSPKAQLLINEFMSPSLSTLKKWEIMKEQSSNYNRYFYIPPSVLGDLLGISRITVNKVMKGLQLHLRQRGFYQTQKKVKYEM